MSVKELATAAFKIVLMRLVHTCVAAEQVFSYMEMDGSVTVSSLPRLFIGNNNGFIQFTDINECQQGIDLCDQICDNTYGSYTCQCNQGFRLDGNGQTCNGKYYELVATSVDI